MASKIGPIQGERYEWIVSSRSLSRLALGTLRVSLETLPLLAFGALIGGRSKTDSPQR